LATINFLEGRRDWAAYAQATYHYSRRSNADLYTLRKTATYVRHFGQELGPVRQQEALHRVLEFMPMLLKQQKNYQNMLLHANLLHQSRQEAQALMAAQEALMLIQSEHESGDDAKALIAEIKTTQNKQPAPGSSTKAMQ
jgi:hypothetical protein